jgi:hypothetical protein
MGVRMLAVHDEIDPVTEKRELSFYTDDGRGNGELIFKVVIESGKPDYWDASRTAYGQLVRQLTAGGADAFLAANYR